MKSPGPMVITRPGRIKVAVPTPQAKPTPAVPAKTTVHPRGPIPPFILGWEAHLTVPVQGMPLP